MSNYRKKALVEIEVWVSSREEVLGSDSPWIFDAKNWRSAILHSNGSIEWQWHDSFDEAVQWCESFIKN